MKLLHLSHFILPLGITTGALSMYLARDQKVEQQPPTNKTIQSSSAQKETPFSPKQINEHKQLWQGYIKTRKTIEENLKTVDRSTARSRSYSPYRALKISETYAYNGDILHRMYFENITNTTTTVGPNTRKLITDNFGTLDKFKEDFMACGQSSRGWVMTAYSYDDGKLYNFLLEEHNQNIPLLTAPLLILDVYEHAYMIDFGIDRTTYLNLFWQNIDWTVVEERFSTYIEPFTKN